MTTVFIIEDETLLRDFIRELIEEKLKLNVIGVSGNGYDALKRCLELKPDLVLLDLALPNLNGQEIIRRLKKRIPKTRILVSSAHLEMPLVQQVMSAGAEGYIEKTIPLEEFCKAVQTILKGHNYYTQRVIDLMRSIMTKPKKKSSIEDLTNREREVLQLVAEGFKSKQVAERLNISEKTAETHRAKVMKKLNLDNAVKLARFALSEGLSYSEKLPTDQALSEESEKVSVS